MDKCSLVLLDSLFVKINCLKVCEHLDGFYG